MEKQEIEKWSLPISFIFYEESRRWIISSISGTNNETRELEDKEGEEFLLSFLLLYKSFLLRRSIDTICLENNGQVFGYFRYIKNNTRIEENINIKEDFIYQIILLLQKKHINIRLSENYNYKHKICIYGEEPFTFLQFLEEEEDKKYIPILFERYLNLYDFGDIKIREIELKKYIILNNLIFCYDDLSLKQQEDIITVMSQKEVLDYNKFLSSELYALILAKK